MFKKIKENLHGFMADKTNRVITAVGTAGTAFGALAVSACAEDTAAAFSAPSIADSVTTSSFNGILTQMTDLLPVILPVVVACLAFRKGISFLKGMIAGA